MRLTVNLSEEHYRAAQAYSKAENLSLSEAVNRLIAFGFHRSSPKADGCRSAKAVAEVFPTSRGVRRVTSGDVAQIEAVS